MKRKTVMSFVDLDEDQRRLVLGDSDDNAKGSKREIVPPAAASVASAAKDASLSEQKKTEAPKDKRVPKKDARDKRRGEQKRERGDAKEIQREDDERREKRQNFILDITIVTILLVMGLMTRFFTWEFPREVVFDEQHFGKFASWYLRGEYYLDIHPPFAKLLITLVAQFGGYDGSWDFDDADRPYEGDFFLWLRFLPVFCGSLLPALMYLTARSMHISPSVSALAGWMVLCENSILTETQYILTDGILFFFDLLTIGLSFKANSKRVFSPAWFFWMFLTGCSLGCATSIKFTAMGVFALVGFHQAITLLRLFPKRSIRSTLADILCRGMLILIPFVVIFFGSFVVHILWLPYEGDGDAFMTREFRKRLLTKNGAQKTPLDDNYEGVVPLTIFQSIKELINTMHEVNIGLRATHPFSSTWNEWALDQCRALLFWQRGKMGYSSWIYCAGNPIIWIGSFVFGILGWIVLYSISYLHSISLFIRYAALSSSSSSSSDPGVSTVSDELLETDDIVLIEKRIASASASISHHVSCKKGGKKQIDDPSTFCSFWTHLQISFERHAVDSFVIWVGYFANWLPFCLIPRATWNYHYIPALLCAILCLSIVLHIVLEAALQYDDGLLLTFKFFCFSLVFAVGAMWLFLSPWNYGIPLSDEQNEARFLFQSWHA